MSDSPVRRVISLENTKVVQVPEAEALVADAMSIIQIELVKMHTSVKRGTSLTEAQGRLLNGYIKSLCELSKEARERAKNTDLSGLSTEQIIELLTKSKDAAKPE